MLLYHHVTFKEIQARHGDTCNSSTNEVEAGESWVQGHPQIHMEFEASLSYLRPCGRRWKGKPKKPSVMPKTAELGGNEIHSLYLPAQNLPTSPSPSHNSKSQLSQWEDYTTLFPLGRKRGPSKRVFLTALAAPASELVHPSLAVCISLSLKPGS